MITIINQIEQIDPYNYFDENGSFPDDWFISKPEWFISDDDIN